MKRYEYRIECTAYTAYSAADLNGFGQDGWELCAVTPGLTGFVLTERYYFFKRELPGEPTDA